MIATIDSQSKPERRRAALLTIGLATALAATFTVTATAATTAADNPPAPPARPIPPPTAPAPLPPPGPLPPPAAPPAAKKPVSEITYEDMQGVDVSGLSDAQKDLVLSLLRDNPCDCSCAMKVAQCRRDDPTCTRSQALAAQVISLVKEGKSRDDIVKAAFTPPPPRYVQFAIKAGEAPALGPPDAKVTVLHYYDYQ